MSKPSDDSRPSNTSACAGTFGSYRSTHFVSCPRPKCQRAHRCHLVTLTLGDAVIGGLTDKMKTALRVLPDSGYQEVWALRKYGVTVGTLKALEKRGLATIERRDTAGPGFYGWRRTTAGHPSNWAEV